MNYTHSTAPVTEITTRHEWGSNIPTTYIRHGNDEITVTGHPRCSIFRVMHRIGNERRGEDVTELDLWEAGASHNEVVFAMAEYLEARRVTGVLSTCPTCHDSMPTCPTCNGSGEVMGVVAA